MKASQGLVTSSPEETRMFAKQFANKLKPGTVICLEGQLGSGKTTFIKGLAEGLGLACSDHVKSPTFVLMHIYKARLPIYHFDCYRLESSEELTNIGFEDFINDPHAISCIEWADKAKEFIPSGARRLHFEVLGESQRRITVS